MIYATCCQIRSLHTEEKLTAGQIARQLQLDRKTVRYWIRHDYRPAYRPNRTSKLDPYKPRIRLEQHEFTAQQILQKLRQGGQRPSPATTPEAPLRPARPVHGKPAKVGRL